MRLDPAGHSGFSVLAAHGEGDRLIGEKRHVMRRRRRTDPQHCSIASVRKSHTATGEFTEIRDVHTPVLMHESVYVEWRC